MDTHTDPEKTTISVYIKADLASKLRRRAEREGRTISREMEKILEKALAKEAA